MSSRTNPSQRLGTLHSARGFTLVEVLVYAAGVVMIVGVIVSMLYYTYGWYGQIASPTRVDQIGVSLADRIENDIRAGSAVNSSGTSLNTYLGSLSLTVFNSATTTTTRTYGVSSGRLTFKEGTNSTQYLSPSDITVSELYFTESTTTNSTGIRFTIGLTYLKKSATSTPTTATSTFTEFGILRNTYQ